MLLAINCYNIIQCDAVADGGVNAETFSSFLRRLMAVLGAIDFTIVMAIFTFHHTAVNNMDHFPYEVKFLQRYSPFLSPWEEAISMLRNRVIRNGVIQGKNDLLRRRTDSVCINPRELSFKFRGSCINFRE
ncbi:hypothetical protein RF11_08202 [Thelohanellus kitauei]|uniref:Uncharacterized protein n=1 Tax=Thelohanellus kitauei TaxID=669202 RepID=A0A0C2N2I9_THEKT|nr:hypothetical protein RF11_08202 [Thelohanellus kitauei]